MKPTVSRKRVLLQVLWPLLIIVGMTLLSQLAPHLRLFKQYSQPEPAATGLPAPVPK